MRSTPASPILGAGELLWDLLPSGPRLGGTTANFAILSARLGDSVALVSRVGSDDLGCRALAELQAVAHAATTSGHFDLSDVQLSTDLPTGTVGVQLDATGRPTYTIVSPVAWDQIRLDDQLLRRAASASAICFGTLAQRHNPSRDSLRAIILATSPTCVRVCDVNLRAPFCSAETLRWCLDQSTVLKISDEELSAVFRQLNISLPDKPTAENDAQPLSAWALTAAHALLHRSPHCTLVAITLGPHGSLLADRTSWHRHPGLPIRVVDTIGAGDAFTAGLVHALTRGASLAQINLVSNLCGSYVASQAGATPQLPQSLLDAIAAALTH
jgi:fructokinase